MTSAAVLCGKCGCTHTVGGQLRLRYIIDSFRERERERERKRERGEGEGERERD